MKLFAFPLHCPRTVHIKSVKSAVEFLSQNVSFGAQISKWYATCRGKLEAIKKCTFLFRI